jgi:hypothetical protein
MNIETQPPFSDFKKCPALSEPQKLSHGGGVQNMVEGY